MLTVQLSSKCTKLKSGNIKILFIIPISIEWGHGVRREYYDTRTYIYIYIDLLPLMTGDKKIWIFNRARHEIKTRQATYVYRNIDARSCKHCYI